jgi:hypothetical protein
MRRRKDKEKIQVLEKEIERLKARLELRDSIGFLLDESIPEEQTKRKRYMADISLFYGSIFKDKLKHFIGLQMEELSRFGRSKESEDFIRGSINVFRLIDEWMALRTNEHLGNLEELRNSHKDDKDFISNFKKIYGED